MIFTITCLVVLLSVVIHGGGIALYLRRADGVAGTAAAQRPVSPAGARPSPDRPTAPPTVTVKDRPSLADTTTYVTPSGPVRAVRAGGRDDSSEAPVPEKITIQEFRDLHRSGEPVIVLDVRTERSYRDHPNIGVGAIRMPPDDAVRLARERRLDMHATLVLYCA
jgi:hypothetical protein